MQTLPLKHFLPAPQQRDPQQVVPYLQHSSSEQHLKPGLQWITLSSFQLHISPAAVWRLCRRAIPPIAGSLDSVEYISAGTLSVSANSKMHNFELSKLIITNWKLKELHTCTNWAQVIICQAVSHCKQRKKQQRFHF